MKSFLSRLLQRPNLRESIRRDNLRGIWSSSLHYRRPAGVLHDAELSAMRSHRIGAEQ